MTNSRTHRPAHQGYPHTRHSPPLVQRGALFPNRGWAARAARELGYSSSYLSRLINGQATSPSAEAALNQWKQLNQA